MDSRREANNIFRQLDRYQITQGESIVWFKFDTTESEFGAVYDEGGKNYLTGTIVPVLWVDQIEDNKTYAPEGRRPTARLHFAVSARTLIEAGVNATEAHGGRIDDPKPTNKTWYDDRLNDLLYYDSRWWEVSNYQIRDRVQGTDVIVGVTAIETQVDDERVWDLFPATYEFQG